MKLRGRKKQVRDYLRSCGDRGATVYEMIKNGCGTDARKRVSELRRLGFNIESKDEGGHSRYWLREEKTKVIFDYERNIARIVPA